MSSQPKILIVDDSQTVRAHVRSMFQGSVQILEATNGKEAVSLMHSHSPTLVLLDYYMPEMNGFDVLRYIQSNASLQRIPVVLMSGRPEDVQEQLPTLLRQVEFLAKPFEPAKLLRASHSAMKKSRAQSSDDVTQTEQQQAEQRQAEQQQAEQRQAEQRQAEQRQSEQRQTEQRQTEQRQAEQRQAEQRQAEQRQAEQRQTEQRQTEQRQAEQLQAAQRQAEQLQAAQRQAEPRQTPILQATQLQATQLQSDLSAQVPPAQPFQATLTRTNLPPNSIDRLPTNTLATSTANSHLAPISSPPTSTQADIKHIKLEIAQLRQHNTKLQGEVQRLTLQMSQITQLLRKQMQTAR
jgi:CheY-like chemotaxis protein